MAQTAPYPLALADINGKMRSCAKSMYKNTLSKLPDLDSMFTTQLPPLEQPTVIIDLLYYLHMPAPSHISTFDQYAVYLWSICVQTFKTRLDPDQIYIVVDKPQYLPPPRDLVHTSRSDRTNNMTTVLPVGSTLPIPHGSEYSAFLCTQEFKCDLIDYITTKFILMAQETHTHMVIDSPSLGQPTRICDDNISSLQPNQCMIPLTRSNTQFLSCDFSSETSKGMKEANM